MLQKIYFILSCALLSSSCAYKAIQPPQYSKLVQNPRVLENKKNYELRLSHPQQIGQVVSATNAVKREKIEDGEFVLTFSKTEGRLLVELLTEERDTVVLSNQRIYFQKAPNFRDLGGIKTQDGKSIQWGKIFRSGHLNGLRKDDLLKIEKMDIQTVVDLRTPAEMTAKPDKYPASTNYCPLNAFEEEQEQLVKTRQAVFKGEISESESKALLTAFYQYYPTENTEVIRKIIHTLLDQNHAVLFHCSAGKDRTGIIGALILSILKVDRETIYQEYLLSNNYRQKSIEKQLRWLSLGRLIYPKLDQEVIENFSWIQTDYLRAAFERIDSKYGSMDKYIEQVLQITETDRQNYIEKFTY